MDLNDLRSAVTVGGLIVFLALAVWVYGAQRREAFREAAELPLRGDEEEAVR